MDPLSGVASGMAVVSLSLQLIQTVSTIHAFVRAVKGAPTELSRLAESLERLRAILQDVCQLIELQTSRSGEHIPIPSMTLCSCLKSCEQQLQPLHDIVNKYESAQAQGGSKSRRLWSSMKLGFKTSDITSVEARIQQEVASLTTALILNSTSIQLHAFPVLIRSQHTMSMSSSSQQHRHMLPREQKHTTLTTHQPISLDMPPSTLITRRVIYSPSYLNRFGFKQHKILRTLRASQADRSSSNNMDKEVVLQEESVYSWAAVWFGYGIRSSRARPYGSILPSLTIFPTVCNFGLEVENLMIRGTVTELQQAFHTGVVHPLTRTEDRRTLLHLAADVGRADLCRLLVEVGVKAEDTGCDYSLLEKAIFGYPKELSGLIDTCRFLLENAQLTDEPMTIILNYNSVNTKFGLLEWLWETGSAYRCGKEAANLRRFCILTSLLTLQNPLMRNSAATLLNKIMRSNIGQHYGPESVNWFHYLFYEWGLSFEVARFEVGRAFVDILLDIDVDVEAFIKESCEIHGTWSLNTYDGPDRQIVFDYSEVQGWVLGWEWVYDAQDPGFLVVSEFSTMHISARKWPFNTLDRYSYLKDLKRRTRFDRRMAIKAQKQLKRSGLWRSRSRMPGAWIN